MLPPHCVTLRLDEFRWLAQTTSPWARQEVGPVMTPDQPTGTRSMRRDELDVDVDPRSRGRSVEARFLAREDLPTWTGPAWA
jgi:hypothetical protein